MKKSFKKIERFIFECSEQMKIECFERIKNQ